MPASALVAERPTDAGRPAAPPAPDASPGVVGPSKAPVAPAVAMAVGLVIVGLAVIGGAHARHGRVVGGASAPAVVVSADPLAITLSARDVSVVTQVYAPGQESGWHFHAGIHAVAVLSGVLTIYDSQCRAQTVEPGRPYVGGQEAHLARNETGSPVEMSVTYLSPSKPALSTQRVPRPSGCDVGPA
jgi:quercetin dioxygenase-like cupin family protein